MSTNTTESETLDLINKFFLKSTLLICSVVCSKESIEFPKFNDDWFHSDENSTYKLPAIINQWVHFVGEVKLPPLVIEVFLDLRGLSTANMVRLQDNEGNLWNVCKGNKKNEIMLERWLVELDDESQSFKTYEVSDDIKSNTQNQLVLLLRYLYTLVQILPVHELASLWHKQNEVSVFDSSRNSGILSKNNPSIGARIVDGSKPILSKGRIGLSKPIISTYSNIINESNIPSHLEQKKITPVWTKFGLLRISVSYRRECKFVVEDLENQNTTTNNTSYHGNGSIKNDIVSNQALRSASLSPRSGGYSVLSSLDKNNNGSNQSSLGQRKSINITRQVQPFKVGSVTSVAMNTQNSSQLSSRNPSNSSFSTGLQGRRTSNSSNAGGHLPVMSYVNNPSNHSINVDSTSIDSGSKYMSSFGNLRRHSSINKNPNLLNPERRVSDVLKPKPAIQQTEVQHNSQKVSEDILNFVKLIDEKPEFKINKNSNYSINSINNISSSLLKFQNFRPSNDILSEDLSLSFSMDPSQESQHPQPLHINSLQTNQHSFPKSPPRRRSNSRSNSNSHSPLPSSFLTPSIPYPSIPSKLAGNDSDNNLSPIELSNIRRQSHESNSNMIKHSISSHRDGVAINNPTSYENSMGNLRFNSRKNSITEEGPGDDEDNLLTNNDVRTVNEVGGMHWKVSSSPRSIDSLSSSFNRNKLLYRQPYQHFSQPTIVPTQAQAKLHKPEIHSTDLLENQSGKLRRDSDEDNNDDEGQSNMVKGDGERINEHDATDDDGLVFFMSDMNLSKM